MWHKRGKCCGLWSPALSRSGFYTLGPITFRERKTTFNVDIKEIVLFNLSFKVFKLNNVWIIADSSGVGFAASDAAYNSGCELASDVLINCGGEDTITSGREQWNDGANTLAIAPGKVIVYSRNHVTNEMLRKEGIRVLEIPSSELSRGRGGPRCMSMPLYREDIKN